MMTDPIADMLTRIRNANEIERPFVEMPATKLKVAVAKVLLEEGFILGYRTGKYAEVPPPPEGGAATKEFREVEKLGEPHMILQVFLKYGPDGEKVIRHIERYSKPGRRVYQGYKDVKRVLDGLGIAILSTSKGVMSDRMAKKEKVGGEVLCTVW
jgi:small subunit ribosomal protein S8